MSIKTIFQNLRNVGQDKITIKDIFIFPNYSFLKKKSLYSYLMNE